MLVDGLHGVRAGRTCVSQHSHSSASCSCQPVALGIAMLVQPAMLLHRQRRSSDSFEFNAKCGTSVTVYLSDRKFSNSNGPLVRAAADGNQFGPTTSLPSAFCVMAATAALAWSFLYVHICLRPCAHRPSPVATRARCLAEKPARHARHAVDTR